MSPPPPRTPAEKPAMFLARGPQLTSTTSSRRHARSSDAVREIEATAVIVKTLSVALTQLSAATPSRSHHARPTQNGALILMMTSSSGTSLQQARRHDPYPWTWEIPLLVGLLLVPVLAAGVQLGRSLANLLAGAGWTWPTDQAAFWRTIPALVGGDASAGLPTHTTGLASPGLVWTGIGAVELLLLIGAGWAAIWALRRWGPGRLKGMATRAEAEQLLGITRLRKVSSIVRPDLYGKYAGPRPGQHPQLSRSVAAGTSGAGTDALGRRLGARVRPELSVSSQRGDAPGRGGRHGRKTR